MSRSYRSVSEMVRDLEDSAFSKDLEREIEARWLAHALFAARCAAGKTQKQVAAAVKRTQSWVSKIESAHLEDMKIGDVQRYARAVGMFLSIRAGKKEQVLNESFPDAEVLWAEDPTSEPIPRIQSHSADDVNTKPVEAAETRDMSIDATEPYPTGQHPSAPLVSLTA